MKEIYESFDCLNLKEKLLRGIYAYGYEKPSSIQQKAIMPIINGKDIIAQAQSGTGKTATFTIGMLQSIDDTELSSEVIILSHTRELALQISNVVKELSKYMNISTNLSVGGMNVRDNEDDLKKNPKIIIGTPGRVLNMFEKNYINKSKLKLLILDEADELLSDLFVNQIYNIFRYFPSNIQVCLFSATMNPNFFKISKQFMRDPVNILVKNEELTLEGIRQYYVNVTKNEFKFETLCDLYNSFSVYQSIIYCNSKKIVDILNNKLSNLEFSVGCIHGDMTQEQRNTVVNDFRNGLFRVLISTDLLSRGIDIQQISIVINYDIPREKENYIHRIGRSGRYGRKGIALNFITNYDNYLMTEIEKFYSTQIEELPSIDVLKL